MIEIGELPPPPEGVGDLVTHFTGWLDKSSLGANARGQFTCKFTVSNEDVFHLVPLRDAQGVMVHVEVRLYEPPAAGDDEVEAILNS